MHEQIALGIDVGSTTVKVVALDADGAMLGARYARAHGRPRQTILTEAEALAGQLGMTLEELEARAGVVGFTGSGGRPVAELLGGAHINELVAQTCAIGRLHPEVRTIIEIGGQDSKFLSVDWDDVLGRMVLSDMAMNNLCAAGTGAFLDQQAERLGIAIENEFAEIALRSENPARIAGRCTVFATSDMVHLQQIGTPMPDILAGLCMALARNFRTVIGKGKAFRPPIAFQGGVAYNRAVVRAFEQTLKLQPGELLVPQHHHVMAAIGCALDAMEKAGSRTQRPFAGFAPLRASRAGSEYHRGTVSPLPFDNVNFARLASVYRNGAGGNGCMVPAVPIYLGIDVGSVTTKVVAIDEHGHLLARRYVRTQGRPLDIVRHCLTEVGQELDASLGDGLEVLAVGTTGSGRHLTADFVGADVVRSEITAQARAAVEFDPEADTVFEIGGQDSKYIRIQNGVVVDFTMNSACAAGTGAFIEEQAARLKVDVEGQFSQLALQSECPVQLGERCTVFMESDLVHHQQQGAGVEDLSAGLAYAIVENYLNRVVGTRALGKRILFLGGVAWNDSVVSAFTARTGRPISVPPHQDVSGAIGAALLARDELHHHTPAGLMRGSRFRGFDLSHRPYISRSFICQACPNLCEINKVTIASEPPVFYGARCDMYDAERARANGSAVSLPDLFAEREALLLGGYRVPEQRVSGRRRVGLPRSLHFYDMFPYWRAFFAELDMDLVLSDATNPTVARLAKEHAIAETCYPVKLVHGHVAQLIERDLDLIFAPGLTSRERIGDRQMENANCPYIRASGDLAVASLKPSERGTRVLTPALHMQWDRYLDADLKTLARDLGVTTRRIRRANVEGIAAQKAFEAQLVRRGAEVLAALDTTQPNVVVVGRPYNTADQGVCQSLPHTLRKLGVLPIPMDYLPVRQTELPDRFGHMYWRCGQDILAAGRIVRGDPRLHAIYVTSFGCGPDSFVIGYFRRLMAGKPFLELELDDHTADAGVVTRCEAFIESLQSARVSDLMEAQHGG